VRVADVRAALEQMASLQRARLELDALDIEGPAMLLARLGGAVQALESRIEGVRRLLGRSAEVLRGSADEEAWRRAREFAWVPAGALLVRVPITPPRIAELDAVLERVGAARRYTVAGNVAFVGWPDGAAALSETLSTHGLTGQLLRGDSGRPFLGAAADGEFERRVRHALDPEGRFGDA
jgi:hypothetical protein